MNRTIVVTLEIRELVLSVVATQTEDREPSTTDAEPEVIALPNEGEEYDA